MARIKRQQRREARGEWVKSGDRSQRWRRTPKGEHDQVQRAVRAVSSTDSSWAQARGRRLVYWIGDRAPHLLGEVSLLRKLASCPWPACPRERLPNVEPQHRSDLVRLLIERYPLPPILRLGFEDGCGQAAWLCPLASVIAGGGGLRQAKELGLISPRTTKRVFAAFIRGPAILPVGLAWRLAQARTLGLPPTLARMAHRAGRWRAGRTRWGHDAYWLNVFRWFALQDLATLPVELIVRYLKHHDIDPQGQRASAVVRRAVAWQEGQWRARHGPMARIDGEPYTPSGLGSKAQLHDTWQIRELATPLELWSEGQRMRHCIWTYHDKVRSRRASIWSLSQHGVPTLTVHVLNKSQQISQVRGFANRAPTATEVVVLRAWAQASGLKEAYR